ncbi:hypothetical protein P148_SR1C00001G0142 [candidate division SR1 bacterium RAAC1_SR1_1]|nr:hypothetical protein P148_SR1C00001G0142 [candidate division SR1 bacterium RAAC1_SR1_1]
MKITKHFDTILVIILALNAIFLLYISFFKKDAVSLEIMKSGGSENFTLVQQLYQHPSYVAQQKDGIQQGLESLGVK